MELLLWLATTVRWRMLSGVMHSWFALLPTMIVPPCWQLPSTMLLLVVCMSLRYIVDAGFDPLFSCLQTVSLGTYDFFISSQASRMQPKYNGVNGVDNRTKLSSCRGICWDSEVHRLAMAFIMWLITCSRYSSTVPWLYHKTVVWVSMQIPRIGTFLEISSLSISRSIILVSSTSTKSKAPHSTSPQAQLTFVQRQEVYSQ